MEPGVETFFGGRQPSRQCRAELQKGYGMRTVTISGDPARGTVVCVDAEVLTVIWRQRHNVPAWGMLSHLDWCNLTADYQSVGLPEIGRFGTHS